MHNGYQPNGSVGKPQEPPRHPNDGLQQERNFCSRCGKRLVKDGVHTCSPPRTDAPEQQEPVAWLCECSPQDWNERNSDERSVVVWSKDSLRDYEADGYAITPIYTTPPTAPNLNCKSVRRRLATSWGYVLPEQQEPVAWDWILGRPYMCHPKMTEKEVAFADGWNALRDRLIKGKPIEWVKRALEAEEINTRLSFELDQLLSPTHMGEPVIHAAPVQPVKQEPYAYEFDLMLEGVDKVGYPILTKDAASIARMRENPNFSIKPLYAAPVSVEAAVLAEREACAEVCDRFAENETGFVAEDCAAAIRARGEK